MQPLSIFEIIERGDWEKLLYYIIEFENLNPYDIDLIKLCDKFLEYVNIAKDLDFRIPAKVLYIAVFLLKLKVDLLFPKEQEVQEKIREILDLPQIDISNLEISPPIKRLPISQVTLDELIISLRKVLELKEKKEKRFRKRKENEEKIRSYFEEIDIEKIVENVFQKILNLIKERENVLFREILENRDWKEIYIKFYSVLHLEMQKRIRTEQQEPFSEISIYLKKI
ncbi:MAG: segregation/condensation protein A [Candidatus Aenigmatarchaeota archaeon]